MKKPLHFNLIFIFIFTLFDNPSAAPFDSGMITLQQPDRTEFTGRIWGDEFIYWMETDDGYRFVQTFDGWFYYATLDQNGEYAPTNYKVGIDSPPASSYLLERSQTRLDEIKEEIEQFNEQIELNRLWYAQKQTEADLTGQPVTLKVGVILIEFTDTTHYTAPYRPDGYTSVDFDSMMFSYNYWIGIQGNQKHPEEEEIFGSFRDYWHQMSRGKLRIEGRVANPDNDQNGVPDWLKAAHTKEYYYNLDYGTEWDSLANEAIYKAIDTGYVDTTNKNSPNYFDKLVILYAGVVRSGGALYVNGHRLGGKYIQLAERSSERLQHSTEWSFTHIGVYLHEFGHNLGFDDEYQFSPQPVESGEDGGTELYNFDLMAWGIYNGPLLKGECPATLSPYYRIRNNWVTPDTLQQDTTNFIVEYDYSNPKFYRIVPIDATEEEHYIFETRKREGFDLYIPSNPVDSVDQAGRLLIWQHNTHSDSPTPGYTDRIRIKPADNISNRDNQLNDFFPSDSHNNYQSFNDTTSPGATINDANPYANKPIVPAHFALNGIQKLSNGNTLIDELKLTYGISKFYYSSGWQLASVPLILTDYSLASVFPPCISAYKFEGNYIQVDTLENGTGYWANFSTEPQEITMFGDFLKNIEIQVNSGWNIIGSINFDNPVANICTEPSDIIENIYKYNGGYVLMTDDSILTPGKGYWVKTTNSGTLFLDKDAEPCELSKITSSPQIDFSEMDKFIITDSESNSQTLFVSNTDIDSSIVHLDTELPPFFPEIDFDSRFEYNEFVKKVSADSGLIELNILVHTVALPVSLSWEINPENGINYSFVGDTTLGKVKEIESISGQVLFNKLNNNKIQLFAKVDGTSLKNLIPKEYNLYQNFPNPFNPSTKIKYDIPVNGLVTLKVYDVLGSEVATLVNEEKTVGRYEVNFDAAALASGVYIYRLSVNDFVNVKKMVLLK